LRKLDRGGFKGCSSSCVLTTLAISNAGFVGSVFACLKNPGEPPARRSYTSLAERPASRVLTIVEPIEVPAARPIAEHEQQRAACGEQRLECPRPSQLIGQR
jgi:hypothetical protein